MAHISAQVEYGLHCLLYLTDNDKTGAPSTRDLAEFQGISPSYVAKLFTRLEKAGLVCAQEGVRGGFVLAKPASKISVLDVVEALDGKKPLFECREIRANCPLFEGDPPAWATRGLCGIHALMREAEREMRNVLAKKMLSDLGAEVAGKIPARFFEQGAEWFETRRKDRAPGHYR